MDVVRWLRQADPAVAWQTLRDLANESDAAVTSERSRVATEGWGAALVTAQAPDGHFAIGGKRGWSTDLHALVLLKDMGLEPTSAQARRTIDRVRANVVWDVCDDRPFFDGETEPCINGAVVAIGAYFGEGRAALVDRLLDEQLADAAGTATLRRAREPRSTARSASSKGCCSTSVATARPPRSRGAASAVRRIFWIAVCYGRYGPAT